MKYNIIFARFLLTMIVLQTFRRSCPKNEVAVTLQWKEQNGYGLVDLWMECSGGIKFYFTHNGNGSWNSKKECKSVDYYGFNEVTGREQGGYGIINTDQKCTGGSGMRSNGNLRGGWNRALRCREGWVITGMEVREQGGYGIINLRPRCSELLE